jgi:hypothetical protein
MGKENFMATQVHPVPSESMFSLKEHRREIIDSALGTTLAEGVSPGPEVIALSERYVEGEITLQEFGASVRSMCGL